MTNGQRCVLFFYRIYLDIMQSYWMTIRYFIYIMYILQKPFVEEKKSSFPCPRCKKTFSRQDGVCRHQKHSCPLNPFRLVSHQAINIFTSSLLVVCPELCISLNCYSSWWCNISVLQCYNYQGTQLRLAVGLRPVKTGSVQSNFQPSLPEWPVKHFSN